MKSVQPTIDLLGYAGLVPFVATAFIAVLASEYAALSTTIANAYAFGIVCFLVGSWWGRALSTGSRLLLVVSNLFFLAAFILFVFAPMWWTLAAALLLSSIYLAEYKDSPLMNFTTQYRRMRAVLTTVAAGSMLTIHFSG